MLKGWVIAGILAWVSPAMTNAQTIVPVSVDSKTRDTVSTQLVERLKESLRNAPGMRLATSASDASVHVHIVAFDPFKQLGDSEAEAVYSVVWTFDNSDTGDWATFESHVAGICPQSRVKACADDLLADTDQVITGLRLGRHLPRYPKALPDY